MRRNCVVLFMVVLCSAGCAGKQARNTADLVRLVGSWKGRQIARFDRPFSERILFTTRPDSSLALSMIFEIGPRSRVWVTDADVIVREGTVRWEDHEGILSKNNDSMKVTRADRGGKSVWLYVRDRSADSLMTLLHAYTAGPYVYEMPESRNDGWQCTDPAASGMDKSRIIDLIEQIRNGKHDDIHSFLLVKDNKLVVEEYFAAN